RYGGRGGRGGVRGWGGGWCAALDGTERRHAGGWGSGILPLCETGRLEAAPPAGWKRGAPSIARNDERAESCVPPSHPGPLLPLGMTSFCSDLVEDRQSCLSSVARED